MNKLLHLPLIAAVSITLTTTAEAKPEYVAPTGAAGCTSCHNDNLGNGFKPGVLEAAASPLGKIAGLKAFLHPTSSDTNPVLHPINSKWDITVGEAGLVIPLQVSDAEDDTFQVHGSAPSGYKLSSVYSKNNLPTVDFKWSPTAAQANKTYPLQLYVQETGTGRTLKSNTIKANIQVWPARTGTTKNVTQFLMQSAQWKNNVLTVSGNVVYKSTLTAAQKTAVMNTLTMSITSGKGVVVSTPKKLVPPSNGNWAKTYPLTATEVPCSVIIEYEGLKAARAVSQAPASSCVK